jgi:hypothetical protein
VLFVYSSNLTDHHDIAEMLSNLINIRSLIHLLSFTDMSQRVRELKKRHYGSHASDTMS